jgi:hypothetical protein
MQVVFGKKSRDDDELLELDDEEESKPSRLKELFRSLAGKSRRKPEAEPSGKGDHLPSPAQRNPASKRERTGRREVAAAKVDESFNRQRDLILSSETWIHPIDSNGEKDTRASGGGAGSLPDDSVLHADTVLGVIDAPTVLSRPLPEAHLQFVDEQGQEQRLPLSHEEELNRIFFRQHNLWSLIVNAKGEPCVSRKHASISYDGELQCYCIVDHGSLNGTFLNEQKLAPNERTPLKDGDRIRIERSVFTFSSAVRRT